MKKERTFDDFLQEQLQDPEFKAEYDKLAPEYELKRQLIRARLDSHLSQKELAEKVGTKQASISRLESGDYNPTIEFLRKIVSALGKEIHIEIR